METLLTSKLFIIYVVQFAKKLKVNKSQFSYDKLPNEKKNINWKALISTTGMDQ